MVINAIFSRVAGKHMIPKKLSPWSLLPLALALLGPAGWAQKAPKKPDLGLKRDAAFRAAVDQAVDRGAAWLSKEQKKDGSWGHHGFWTGPYKLGPTALALLTLIHCGKAPRGKEVESGFKYLLKGMPSLTYEVGLALMALEARATPMDEWETRRQIHRGKKIGSGGGLRPFRYLTKEERAFASLFASWLVRNRYRGTWHYKEYPMSGDHSNTQYALLGLRAAARMGVKINPRVWLDSMEHFLRTQAVNGPRTKLLLNDYTDTKGYHLASKFRVDARGWGYPVGGPPGMVTGSMTAVGLAALVICRDELSVARNFAKAEKNPGKRNKLHKKTSLALQSGLAWLQNNLLVKQNPKVMAGQEKKSAKGKKKGRSDKAEKNAPAKKKPKPPERDYYYLYGLERAMVLTAVNKLGDHDWYREGAEFLLKIQEKDGKWHNDIGWRSHLTATCFALLFLKRSTYPPVITGTKRR